MRRSHLIVSILVAGIIVVGAFAWHGYQEARKRALEAKEREKPAQIVERVPSPPEASRILTKDAEFVQLLHPSTNEDDVLAHSSGYLQKKREIDAKLSSISDPELRERLSAEEWAKVDKAGFLAEGEDNLRASFLARMRACLERHRADWFEIGHVDYPGSTSLLVNSVEASPLELPEGAAIAMDLTTMDAVYSRFRQAADQQIREKAAEWMSNQSCEGRLKNTCKNLGGSSAECSDPAQLREIEERLGTGGILIGCTDNPSAEEGSRVAEKELRSERLVLVGHGDLLTHRIDKLLLIDYNSETVLLEMSPAAMTGKLTWKFPAANQETASSVAYKRLPDTDALKDFGAVAVHAQSQKINFNMTNEHDYNVPIEPSIQDGDAKNFVLENGCSYGPLGPQGMCEFVVYFSPEVVGLHTATLVLGSNWNPSEITLRGYGTSPWDIYEQTQPSQPIKENTGAERQ